MTVKSPVHRISGNAIYWVRHGRTIIQFFGEVNMMSTAWGYTSFILRDITICWLHPMPSNCLLANFPHFQTDLGSQGSTPSISSVCLKAFPQCSTIFLPFLRSYPPVNLQQDMENPPLECIQIRFQMDFPHGFSTSFCKRFTHHSNVDHLPNGFPHKFSIQLLCVDPLFWGVSDPIRPIIKHVLTILNIK